MIYFWLIVLGLAYVVVAVAVGKICAINSRWEKTVDQLPMRKPNVQPPFEPGSNAMPLRNVTVSAGGREKR